MSQKYTIQVKYEVTIKREILADSLEDALSVAQDLSFSNPVDCKIITIRKPWAEVYISGEATGVFA